MQRRRQTAMVAVAMLLALSMAVIEPAVASAATDEVGRNIGRLVTSWATALLLGVAALVAIPVLAKRDIGGGVSLVILVVLVGGFVYAPGSVKSVIDGLWRAIAG